MNTKLTLALLSSAAMAKVPIDTSVFIEFANFIGQFGKNYSTMTEMTERMLIWLDNKMTVDGLNAANAGTGVTFGMNETSDLTDDEFKELLGLIVP